MSDRLHVATRKGLFTIDRQAGQAGSRWAISKVDFLGDPVTMVLQDPRDGWLYAALKHGHFGVKLHRSLDSGQTWEECTVPAYPEQPDQAESEPAAQDSAEPSKAPSLNEIWSLEAGGKDEPDLLWAGTIPGGLFRSRDRGSSWELIRCLWDRPERKEWFGGGKDEPGIHSICVDPRDSAHVTVAVSCGGVWVTRDGGETWSCRADGMWAAYMPPDRKHDPIIQDVHRMVNCPSSADVYWVQHHNGIFRSTDGADSWQEITEVTPSSFGFAAAVHPNDSETAWFVPAVNDECRVPADAHVVVTRTRDGGRTFDALSEGLPQKDAYDIVFRHALDVDSSGNRLALGSSTGSLWITENSGDSWQSVSTHMPQIYCIRFAPLD